jgi:asparagine synthase (glutamine-hydrolysing)
MCGISGTVRQSADGPALVQELIHLQHRRGPDHSQWLECDGRSQHLTFGHNRLAILDLDSRSNQPFVDKRTHQLLVYNGEIYNYLELKQELMALGHDFHTTSDTEVLLKSYQQWGLEAFEKFNGMFAFALYDPERERTLLVRDRFGVKPLYYHLHNGWLTFASSPAALARSVKAPLNIPYLALGVRRDLFEGLTFETAYGGILAVPPGHCLIYEKRELREHRYYDLSGRVSTLAERLADNPLDENVAELRELLMSSVELRLRSDVPVTLSLSGGLDSGICAALMREVRGSAYTAFTFASPEWEGSEAGLAQRTAEHLGVGLEFAAPSDFGQLFSDTLEAQGAPFADPSVLGQHSVFASIHAKGYKVSLGGQGADEAFAGYRKFQLSALRELRRRGDWGSLLKQGMGTGWTFTRELGSPQDYVSRFIKSHRSAEPAFFAPEICPMPSPAPPAAETLRARQLLDVQRTSLPTLLRYEDSNSMFHSIESRMPFLDYRVMEFGLALPLEHKVQGGFGKFILRKLADGLLPKEIVWDRKKRAFSLHPTWWLTRGLGRGLFEEVQSNLKYVLPLLEKNAREQISEPGFFLRRKNFTKMVTLIYLIRHGATGPEQ